MSDKVEPVLIPVDPVHGAHSKPRLTFEEYRERVRSLLTHIEDVVSDEDWDKIDHKLWNAVSHI